VELLSFSNKIVDYYLPIYEVRNFAPPETRITRSKAYWTSSQAVFRTQSRITPLPSYVLSYNGWQEVTPSADDSGRSQPCEPILRYPHHLSNLLLVTFLTSD
jgi:hypothetical protein